MSEETERNKNDIPEGVQRAAKIVNEMKTRGGPYEEELRPQPDPTCASAAPHAGVSGTMERAIEAVAKAIGNAEDELDVAWEEVRPIWREHYLSLAKAAIDAYTALASAPALGVAEGRWLAAEAIADEAQKIIDGLQRERERPFSGFADSPTQAVERLRNRLISLTQPAAPHVAEKRTET